MEFRLLGPAEIRIGDRVLDAGHARQRAVLAVLLLDLNRVVASEVLIDRVWDQDPPASVRSVLYGHVARLRSALATGDAGVSLARRSGGYLLQADAQQLDVGRFRALAAQAAAADDVEKAALLRRALELWHGPTLAGLHSRWLDAMRESLELERAAAARELTDIRLRHGEHTVLVAELAGQAGNAPTDEQLIGQLMLALYRSGQSAEALRWFEQTRQQLAGELGADPGPQLKVLHQRILRADPTLALPASAPIAAHVAGDGASDRARPVPHELPADVAAFTGRAAELSALDKLLLSPPATTAAVISAVSGTAGVGKTALAVHWAHRAAEQFPDGQLHVNLRGYDPAQPLSAGDALARFLRSLGVPGQDIPADEEERAARYRSLLAGKRMLILLDNAGTADQVRPLLPGHPGCKAVVTSRDSLAGLVVRDGARRLDVDLLPLDDAVALLRDLIGDRADADPAATAALAEQCCRLPLALRVAAELAAARPAAPLSGLVTELSDQQERLQLLHADSDARTEVRAVFSWSYRHLDADSARAFRLAGLHPGPDFDAYAVAAVADSTVEQARYALDALTRGHLIQATSPGRYGMHDLLRAYAGDLTATHDGTEGERAALTRLFDFYLRATATAMNSLYPEERGRRPEVPAPSTPVPSITDQVTARDWLDSERAAMSEIVRQAANGGWPAHATRLATILYRYLVYGGFLAEARSIHTHARDAARSCGDRAAEATALNDLGVTEWQQGHYQHAAADLRASLEIFREVSDRAGQARVKANLGHLFLLQGRYRESIGHHRESLDLYRQLGDLTGQASAFIGIGNSNVRLGLAPDAAESFRQAMNLSIAAGDRSGEARALNNLGVIAENEGRSDEAAGHYLKALPLFREAGYRTAEASVLGNLGTIYRDQGLHAQAAEHLTAALNLYREIGQRSGEAETLNLLGLAMRAADRPDDALLHHRAALELAEQAGLSYEQARAHDGLGQVAGVLGDSGGRLGHWQQALAIYAELGTADAERVRSQLASLADR